MKKITFLLPGLMLVAMAFAPGCKHEASNAPASFLTSETMAENAADTALAVPAATTVHVCKSTGAKRYHPNEKCRGLKQCTHEVVTMTVKEAEGKGLTLCGYED